MFSERVPRSLSPNRITRAVSTARSGATPIVDLTITNPTCAGIDYPVDLLAALSSPDGLKYTPEPFGLPSARAAVAADYARRGETVDPRRIVLTASTSEAYTLLFKLLCAPRGDDALVPTPSYPLFDHLTMLDGVRAVPYRLEYHGRWTLAAGELDRAWTDGVRAVLAVSPNNPTGSIVSDDELQELSDRCARRHAALIVDEVFADYPIEAEKAAQRPAAPPPCLTFRLGGLSKSAGLPQVKLGWIAVDGPEALVEEALERLEVVCDAYLSVSTPVQVAAPSLIASGAAARAQILRRVRQNNDALRAAAARHPAVDVLPTEAGWSAVVRVPSTRSEEDLVVDLLEQDRILVHPGFFFDFPHESFVVVSLLPEPAAFADGVRRLLERVDG
jgi:alanine-synthesizing transaminase